MLEMDTSFDLNGDPAPRFATDAEIDIAERLRHQIEERYLSHSTVPTPSRPRTADGH